MANTYRSGPPWLGPTTESGDRMRTITIPRALLLTVLLTLGMFGISAPAYADRCQPEELVTGPGTGLLPEEKNPVCQLLIDNVYTPIGCDGPLAQCPRDAACTLADDYCDAGPPP